MVSMIVIFIHILNNFYLCWLVPLTKRVERFFVSNRHVCRGSLPINVLCDSTLHSDCVWDLT